MCIVIFGVCIVCSIENDDVRIYKIEKLIIKWLVLLNCILVELYLYKF